MRDIQEYVQDAPVVTVFNSPGPEEAVWLAKILVAEGFPLFEITFRNENAGASIRAVVDAVPGAIVGAGTVLTREQGEEALQAGARFLVSPGFAPPVLELAREKSVPYLPGVVTPTEIQNALAEGLRDLKFFPASINGGPTAIAALAAVFPAVRFMPTGGISQENLSQYLRIPAVLACGGSFLAPAAAIRDRNAEAILQITRSVRELL